LILVAIFLFFLEAFFVFEPVTFVPFSKTKNRAASGSAIAPAPHASHAFAAQLLGDSLKMLHRSILTAFSRRSLGGQLRCPAYPLPKLAKRLELAYK